MFTYKSAEYGQKNKRVVFLLSGWAFDRRFFTPVAYLLVLGGYKCRVYSYDASILSPNINLTLARFEFVKKEILSDIQNCSNHGDIPYAIFGTSLGALLALMVNNEYPYFEKIILNLTGADIAEVIWTWDIVKPGFKKALQLAGVTLELLKTSWKPISPINNLNNLNSKEILIYLSQRDEIIPFSQGEKLLEEFKARKYNYTAVVNKKLRHLPAAIINLLNFPIYINFLKKS